MASLQERLIKARKRRRLTQAQMAVRCGVSQSAVSLWEAGKAGPIRHVEEVEREYGVRISRDELIEAG